MSLDKKVIKDFVAAVNKKEETKTPTILTGTVHREGGTVSVKIDGSESLTPVSTVINVEDGERVTLTIENHKAMITGNLSSPAARGNEVEDLKVIVGDKVNTAELEAITAKVGEIDGDVANFKETTTEKLTAQDAKIDKIDGDVASFKETTTDKLTAQDAKIGKIDGDVANFKETTTEKLNANSAAIGNLDSTFANFKDATADKFKANDADIDKLKTGKLSAEDADLKYANIDFSNIGKTAMEYFYAQSGLVKDVKIGDATITGELVGVTIKGDLLEGNTVVADKLVIKGSDGLYYKLNTDGMAVEKEQTDYNSLNGQVIRAKSITATKIDVEDLVAFGATIGGFKISQNSIYSGVKETVGNTTRGIYMDNDGQFVFGDANQYVKFYRVSEGKYKLAIAVEDLYIGSANVADAISDAKNTADNAAGVAASAKSTAESANNNVTALTKRVTEAETSIKKNNEEIALRAKKTEVTEAIDNIDIGGRNLIRSTNQGITGWGWEMETGGFTGESITEDDINTAKMTRDSVAQSGWSYIANKNILLNKLKPATKYVLSVEIKSNVDTRFDVSILRGDSSGSLSGFVYLGDITKGKWNKISCIIETLSDWSDVGGQCIYINGMDSSPGVWYQFRNLKLERGNKPTDWTPAPEDYYTKTETDASIEVLSDKITQQVSTTDDLGKRMSKVEQDSSSWSVTLETANAAKSAADSANKNASNAVSTANNAQKTAENAVSTASSASSTATEAKSTADQANQTASTANSTASAAKSTAENATSTANAAKSAADKANTAANTARTEAAAAAKTATNYMKFDDSGLTVGNLTEKTLGRNVNIDNSSVNIRNGNNVLASFAESLIEIGKNTNTATISFLNGIVKLIGQKQTIEGTTFYDAHLLSANMMTLGTGSTDPSSDKVNALISLNGMSGEREVLASVTDTQGHSTLTLIDSSASLYSDGDAGYSSVDVICNNNTSQVELRTNGSNGNRVLVNYSHAIQYYNNSTILAAYNGQTPCLWDGYVWMRADQTATLSAPISEQPHGIIVIFALFDPTTNSLTNVMTNPFFVPKTAINYDYIFTMFWENAWQMCTKRVTIQNTCIIGNDQNESAAFKANTGITTSPQYFVLRRVYGV